MQKSTPISFVRWTSSFFGCYAVLEGVTLGLASLASSRSLRSLSLPFAMQLCVGLSAGSLIYWARQSLDRPKSGALRFSIAIFVSLLLFMPALGLSVVRLGWASDKTIWSDYAPAVLPGSVIAAVLVYRAVRKRLEAAQRAVTISR
jgi:hypothetical protein